MTSVGFGPGEILIPKQRYLEKFAVVACDQFTSEPEYWRQVEELTRGVPTAYRMMFPEALLGKVDFESKIREINGEMEKVLEEGVFESYPEAMVYVRRQLKNGKIRKGLLGLLDLEQYDYHKGAQTLIRASEGTVLERIPPRVKIRQGAPLEMPHVLILIDDPDKTVLEPLEREEKKPLYQFDLMMGGGRIEGFEIQKESERRVLEGLSSLCGKNSRQTGKPPLLFAVGDGNHSLASAKACYEELKSCIGSQALTHPARYALAEIENIHDSAQEFEPIHRLVTVQDARKFIQGFKEHFKNLPANGQPPVTVRLISRYGEEAFTLENPDHTLAVGAVQKYLDAQKGIETDYIHGEEAVRRLAREEKVGILLPVMDKKDFFKTVLEEGALPRKTFSMGEASEKRYYLECRRIR